MSEFGAYLLLGLITLILVLVLCILFWKPNEIQETQKAEDECQPGTYDIRKTIGLCWPELLASCSITDLEHGVMLHWSGLCGKKRTAVFSVTAGNMMNACMNALTEIIRGGIVPENDCWFVIAERREKDSCRAEASVKLREMEIFPDSVYEEGTGIIRDSHALFTTAGKAEKVLLAEGGSPEKFAAETAFPFVYSENLRHTLKAFGRKLPFMLRLQFALRFMTGRIPFRNLLRIFPEADEWVRSSLTLQEKEDRKYLILCSPDDREAERALSDLLNKASLYGIRLYQESEKPAGIYCLPDSETYRSASGAIIEMNPEMTALPVVSGKGVGWPGWQTVCFTPSGGEEKDGTRETEYYKKLII